MADASIGEIRMFAGVRVPRDWLRCDGALLGVPDFPELFSLIGFTYGGDHRSVFALPDLGGRVAIGTGQGPSLPAYPLGATGGSEAVTLTTDQIPAHGHSFFVTGRESQFSAPSPAVGFGNPPALLSFYIDTTKPTQGSIAFNADAVSVEGSGQPHYNMMPYRCIPYIICYRGSYPR